MQILLNLQLIVQTEKMFTIQILRLKLHKMDNLQLSAILTSIMVMVMATVKEMVMGQIKVMVLHKHLVTILEIVQVLKTWNLIVIP